MTPFEDAAVGDAPIATRPTVFVSYARADAGWMLRIAHALEAEGYRVNYDTAPIRGEDPDIGIAAGDEWWVRLQEMIAGADVMLLLVSPASAASRIVDDEIACARSEGKRIVPVLCQPIDFAAASPRLAALNVRISVAGATEAAFAAALAQLRASLDQDLDWLRLGRTLNQKAHEWRTSGRTADRLLRGEAIADAERWSARRPPTAPPVAETVLAYVADSRAADEASLARTRTQLDRQRRAQRRIGWLTGIVLGVTLLAAGFVVDRQRPLARSQSVMLARVAEESLTRGDHVRALRLAALGLDRGWLGPGSMEADSVFRRAVQSPVLEREFDTGASVVQDWASADGTLVALVGEGVYALSFWRPATGSRVGGHRVEERTADVGFAVSPDGRRFLSWHKDLKANHAMDAGAASDAARVGRLWRRTDAGNVEIQHEERYPVSGGLLPSDDGPAVTWNRTTLTLWTTTLDRRLAATRWPSPVEYVRAIGDGDRIVVVLADGRVEVRSTRPSTALALLAHHAVGRPVRGLTVVQDANLVLVVTASDDLVALDLDTLAVRFGELKQQCCFGPPLVASMTFDGVKRPVLVNAVPRVGIRLVRAATGESFGKVFDSPGMRGAAMDRDGTQLITVGLDDIAHVWDVRRGSQISEIRHQDLLGPYTGRAGPRGGMRGAVFLSRDAVLIWNDDGTIRIHDTRTGAQLGSHMRQDGPVRDALLLPQDRVLTVSDGPTRIWRLPEFTQGIATRDQLCASGWRALRPVRLERSERYGTARAETVMDHGVAATGPALVIDAEDTRLAPILSGREGEDLCD